MIEFVLGFGSGALFASYFDVRPMFDMLYSVLKERFPPRNSKDTPYFFFLFNKKK